MLIIYQILKLNCNHIHLVCTLYMTIDITHTKRLDSLVGWWGPTDHRKRGGSRQSW